MTLMNNTSYTVENDKLLIDSKHPIDVKIVDIAANQGTVKRGTVLSLTNTGEYLVFGTTLTELQTSAKANCIVADDVDTTTSTNDTTVPAVVYISGHFNKNEFIVAEEASLTTSDIEDLRDAGIFVSSSN